MKFKLICSSLILATSLNSYAQKEIGIFLGASNYLGELNHKPIGQLGWAAGIMYRSPVKLFQAPQRWAFTMNAFYGNLRGDDSKSNSSAEVDRNLKFKSMCIDVAARLEFNFLKYEKGHELYRFTPFLFLGLGATYTNPKAELNGSWYTLQKMHTEGQTTTKYPDRDPYKRLQPTIPFGIGVKYSLSSRVAMCFEYGLRKTFADYIDDVSKTYPDKAALLADAGPESVKLSDPNLSNVDYVDRDRGNRRTKDWTQFIGVSFMFTIKEDKPCAAYDSVFE